MRLKSASSGKAVGFNMTPMIDIVFQLIIFFMLVTEFANTQLEQVRLAKASQAEEDKLPPKDRLVINLAHLPSGQCQTLKYDMQGNLVAPCPNREHWKVKINNRVIRMPELIQRLIIEGDLDRKPPPRNKPTARGFSNRVVMLRADAGVPYKIMERVLSACAEARLHKLEIGVRKPTQ